MDPQQKAILSKHSVKFIRNETKKKSQIIEVLSYHKLYDSLYLIIFLLKYIFTLKFKLYKLAS